MKCPIHMLNDLLGGLTLTVVLHPDTTDRWYRTVQTKPYPTLDHDNVRWPMRLATVQEDTTQPVGLATLLTGDPWRVMRYGEKGTDYVQFEFTTQQETA